jgi:hypothetical protein
MKIQDILLESKHDDWDDDREEMPSDPDSDKVQHILMQFKKAMDVGGNYPITFKSGEKAKVSLDIIEKFVQRYASAKPLEREQMQTKAIQSIDGLKAVLAGPSGPKAEKSLYQRGDYA